MMMWLHHHLVTATQRNMEKNLNSFKAFELHFNRRIMILAIGYVTAFSHVAA
jgi:hypothetical protein